VTSALLLGSALANLFDPARPLEVPAAASNSHKKAMKKFGDEIWTQLLDWTTPEPDGWSWHRFYVRMEPKPLRRLVKRVLHFSFLATRAAEMDVAFAARIGLKRKWQAQLLRPIRLLLREGSRA